jgi:hypothetical protein
MTGARLPASPAGIAKKAIFGSASLRFLAPQIAFEVVRSQVSALGQANNLDVRWPAPANENRTIERNDAA